MANEDLILGRQDLLPATYAFPGWSSGSYAPHGNLSLPALQAVANPGCTGKQSKSVNSEGRNWMRRMGTQRDQALHIRLVR
ncbi:MAG: hypothetical protein FD168_1097 [Desulfobulbaceae bacterium]|nr:MAG: hypothetical protein FD168_1097 [Desulfobulbaceae bacterium]